MMPPRRRLGLAFVMACVAAATPAQEPQTDPGTSQGGEPRPATTEAGGGTAPTAPAAGTPTAQSPQPSSRHHVELRYPRDRDFEIALVDGLPITLDDIVRHLDATHCPGLRTYLAGPDDKGTPQGALMLSSDLVAPWVRHYADIKAMELEAKATERHDQDRIRASVDRVFAESFDAFVADYAERRRQQGITAELDERAVTSLRYDFRMRMGLSCEAQGWLDYLEPQKEWTNQELADFFQEHPDFIGGGVKIQHILVQNRDAGTGLMLDAEGRARAVARLGEIRTRLRPDGSNFEEVAAWGSEDTKALTGDGGMLNYVERFDERLPPAICRTAWALEDGQVSDVVETQYGWHIIRRLGKEQRMFLMFSRDTEPIVRRVKQRLRQEDLLFSLRKRYRVELRL